MTAAHHRLRPALLAVLTLLFLLLPSFRSYAAEPPEVLRAVHTDALHTTYDGTSLGLSTRIGLGEYRVADPAGLIFNLEDKGSARVELPDLPAFAFLGQPGDSVWIAPESQDPELIWPGWDTETIAPGVLAGDSVDLTLLSSSGPGNVEVFFNYDEFTGTAQRLFSAADPALRVLHQPVGRHVHANWAFTQLGTYQLTFQATATTTTGVPVNSGPVVYTFVVGPYEPSTPPTTPPGTPPTTPPGTPPTTPPTTPPGTPPTTPPGTPPTTPPGTPPTTPPGTPSTTPPGTPPGTPPNSTPTTRPTQQPTATATPSANPTQVAPRPTATPSSADRAEVPPKGDRIEDQSSKLPPCVSTPSGGGTNGPGSTNSPGGVNSPGGSDSPGGSNSPGDIGSPGGSNSPGNTNSPGGDQTRTTLSNGHADYAVRLEGGRLASRVKDGTKPGTPVWRDPAKVTIQLTAASQTRAPGGAFAFLGPAGAPLWQIPQTQKDGVVWLGWNTEELSSSQLSTGVDWRLDRVTGPGNLAVFEFDSFGRPKIIFNSGDGVPDTYRIPLGTHAHGNWSFTKPGTYHATFTHTATLTTGATSTTTSTLTFVVGGATTNAHTSAYTGGGANAQSAIAFTTDTHRTSAGDFVHELSKSRPENAQVVHKVAGEVGISAGGGCKLASTGGEVGLGWIAGGTGLVVAGVVALVATRRRQGDA